MDDIADILAFEVKKELADRYFSFRKQIEDDSAAYSEQLDNTAVEVENELGNVLLRLYLLLQNERMVNRFLTLTGLPQNYLYDPYFHESATIRIVAFKGCSFHGLTKKQRFKNMFFDCYQELLDKCSQFQLQREELVNEQETIEEAIKLFYRNNDIDTIMDFLRRLDTNKTGGQGLMQMMVNTNSSTRLNDQLRFHPPRPVSERVAPLPHLPMVKTIKKELSQILNDVWKEFGPYKLRFFTGSS